MSSCACGSGREFSECCEPLLNGSEMAATAEALMRARYTAYVKGYIAFLGDSLHPAHRHDWDEAATRKWAETANWRGLNILATDAGGADDTLGIVEFTAEFDEDGIQKRHHEISRFRKENGRWYYVDGGPPKPQTVKREAAKVGRNEPCPCGSGKKYKKCCAA